MSPDPLDLIWRAADLGMPIFTGDEMPQRPAGALEVLRGLGILCEGKTASHVVCDACADGHVEAVNAVSYPDGRVRFFIACPEHGRIEVDRVRLVQWTVNFEPFGRFLAEELATKGEIKQRVPSRVWEIGRASLAGRSRPVWMARGLSLPDAATLSGSLPSGRSPVLFVLGGMPRAGVVTIPPDSIMALNQMLSLAGGLFVLDRAVIEDQLSIPTGPAKEKRPRRRAERTAKIDALETALIQYISAYRESVYNATATGRRIKPTPRPTQKLLAAQLGLTAVDVSRAMNDVKAHTLRLLWEIAGDAERMLEFRGL